GNEEGQYENDFPRVFHAWSRTKHEGYLFLDRGASRWARAHLTVKGAGGHVLGRGTSTHVRAPSRAGATEIRSRFEGVLAQVLRLPRRREVADAGDEAEAVLAGHGEVAQDDVGRELGERVHPLLDRGDRPNGGAGHGQDLCQGLTRSLIVLEDEHPQTGDVGG